MKTRASTVATPITAVFHLPRCGCAAGSLSGSRSGFEWLAIWSMRLVRESWLGCPELGRGLPGHARRRIQRVEGWCPVVVIVEVEKRRLGLISGVDTPILRIGYKLGEVTFKDFWSYDTKNNSREGKAGKTARGQTRPG